MFGKRAKRTGQNHTRARRKMSSSSESSTRSGPDDSMSSSSNEDEPMAAYGGVFFSRTSTNRSHLRPMNRILRKEVQTMMITAMMMIGPKMKMGLDPLNSGLGSREKLT